jgi:SPP1 family predicted phage head-tail adaptor
VSARATIGALRHRVTLEAAIDIANEFGGFTRGYAPVAQVWAQIGTLGSGEQFTEQRLEQATRSTVRIRWRADVKSQMRFLFGDRKLLIRTVESDERRRFLTCLCEDFF